MSMTQNQNPADEIATTAGVATTDDNGDVNIRGSRTGVDVYVDGIRYSNANIPVQEIEQLQVITGGVEAQYGDNVSGLYSITTKEVTSLIPPPSSATYYERIILRHAYPYHC